MSDLLLHELQIGNLDDILGFSARELPVGELDNALSFLAVDHLERTSYLPTGSISPSCCFSFLNSSAFYSLGFLVSAFLRVRAPNDSIPLRSPMHNLPPATSFRIGSILPAASICLCHFAQTERHFTAFRHCTQAKDS